MFFLNEHNKSMPEIFISQAVEYALSFCCVALLYFQSGSQQRPRVRKKLIFSDSLSDLLTLLTFIPQYK